MASIYLLNLLLLNTSDLFYCHSLIVISQSSVENLAKLPFEMGAASPSAFRP